MQIIKYETEEEVAQIIAQKESEGFVLIEVQNITEGNFLGFFKEEDLQVIPQNTDATIKEIQEQIEELILILGDLILGGA